MGTVLHMTNSRTAKLSTIKPGTAIRVCQTDRAITLPVYAKRLNADATVLEIRENNSGLIPCVEIVTDLGTCRGNWNSMIHLAA